VTFTDIADKAQRTAIHQFFKQDFDLPHLVTDTLELQPGQQALRVMTHRDLQVSVKHACAFTPCIWPSVLGPWQAH
jgi:hypothetical protein